MIVYYHILSNLLTRKHECRRFDVRKVDRRYFLTRNTFISESLGYLSKSAKITSNYLVSYVEQNHRIRHSSLFCNSTGLFHKIVHTHNIDKLTISNRFIRMSGKEEFLSKSARTKCWSSRDNYWECLRSNNEEATKCADLRKMYESSCPLQWVNWFKKKNNN